MTVRDVRVLEFLTDFKVAKTSTLSGMFFDNKLRVAQRRLKAMEEENLIKHVNEKEYVYYTKLPKQYMHAVMLTDYIGYLSKYHEVKNMLAEYKCGDLRSDALIYLDGMPTFIEIQLSGSPDISKYLDLKVSKLWEKEFKRFPTIRILGNAPEQKFGLDILTDSPIRYSNSIR